MSVMSYHLTNAFLLPQKSYYFKMDPNVRVLINLLRAIRRYERLVEVKEVYMVKERLGMMSERDRRNLEDLNVYIYLSYFVII